MNLNDNENNGCQEGLLEKGTSDAVRSMQVSAYNRKYYMSHRSALQERQRNRYRDDAEYRAAHRRDMLQRYHRRKAVCSN